MDRVALATPGRIFVLAALLASCAGTAAEEKPGPAGQLESTSALDSETSPTASAIPVRVAEVIREDVSETLDLTGTAQAWDEFRVASEVSGRVAKIYAEEGDWVKKGQLLLELNRQKRLIELRSRQASLARFKVELEFARKNLARGKALLKKGAISQSEVDSLDQVFQVQRTAVQVAEIGIESIQQEIEDTRIQSPATGQISRRHVSLGEMVNSSLPLFTVIQVDPLKIMTEISEPYLHRMHAGHRVEVRFEALSDKRYFASIHFIQPVANPRSGAFPLEVELRNRDNRFQPGMVARVQIEASTFRDALTVPLDAIVDLQGETYVYVVEAGVAHRRRVEVRKRIGARAVLTGLLHPGDQLVTSGNLNITDGTPVEVIP
ncbi:MAG: efflux RND transporter periplasmic adaptor subunit [Acidobacteriota bacterium]